MISKSSIYPGEFIQLGIEGSFYLTSKYGRNTESFSLGFDIGPIDFQYKMQEVEAQ